MECWNLSAVELAEGIRNRCYSCTDVVTSVLERIRQRNPELNAITVDCSADALIDAEGADAAIRRGEISGRSLVRSTRRHGRILVAFRPAVVCVYRLRPYLYGGQRQKS